MSARIDASVDVDDSTGVQTGTFTNDAVATNDDAGAKSGSRTYVRTIGDTGARPDNNAVTEHSSLENLGAILGATSRISRRLDANKAAAVANGHSLLEEDALADMRINADSNTRMNARVRVDHYAGAQTGAVLNAGVLNDGAVTDESIRTHVTTADAGTLADSSAGIEVPVQQAGARPRLRRPRVPPWDPQSLQDRYPQTDPPSRCCGCEHRCRARATDRVGQEREQGPDRPRRPNGHGPRRCLRRQREAAQTEPAPEAREEPARRVRCRTRAGGVRTPVLTTVRIPINGRRTARAVQGIRLGREGRAGLGIVHAPRD